MVGFKNVSIGEVFDVNSQFGVQIEADRVAKKELGGGALLDIGIYCVQFSQFIFEVHAFKITNVII